jgi:hypothetical protein
MVPKSKAFILIRLFLTVWDNNVMTGCCLLLVLLLLLGLLLLPLLLEDDESGLKRGVSFFAIQASPVFLPFTSARYLDARSQSRMPEGFVLEKSKHSSGRRRPSHTAISALWLSVCSAQLSQLDWCLVLLGCKYKYLSCRHCTQYYYSVENT